MKSKSNMEHNINDLVTVVQLEYLEPGFTEQTRACLVAAGFDPDKIIMATREGVGSMSLAFNRAVFGNHIKTPFVWWVTNIRFEPDVPVKLVDAFFNMRELKPAAVHPGFMSDHSHIRNARNVEYAPFIELTAPMFETNRLRHIGPMDEKLPYIGMDIDFSYRAAQFGYKFKVDGTARIEHTYLHQSAPHPISRIRASLRQLHMPATYARLEAKYGPDWKTKICPGGAC